MNMLLENKVCIITGAGRGIGQAIAQLFAEYGATVYANDLIPGCMDAWVEEFNQGCDQRKILPSYFDITDEAQVRQAVMDIKKEAGRIDVLVNNAGVEFNELIGMISEENKLSVASWVGSRKVAASSIFPAWLACVEIRGSLCILPPRVQ